MKSLRRWIGPTIRALPVLTAVLGALIIASHVTGDPAIPRLIPGAPVMPWLTAAMLIASSVIVAVVRQRPCSFRASSGIAGLTAAMAIIAIGEIMPLFAVFAGIALPGIPDPEWIATPGVPSVGALWGFILIAFAGVCGLFEDGRWVGLNRVSGVFVFAVGGYAVVGHILGLPGLYYYVPGVSRPMAVGTALAFVALGISLIVDEQMLETPES